MSPHRHLLIIIATLITAAALPAQGQTQSKSKSQTQSQVQNQTQTHQKVPRQSRTEKEGLISETYQVLASDTTVRDGNCEVFYRNQLIEKGLYRNGVKVGIWEYRNYHGVVEFRYNHTKQRPTYVVPHVGKTYKQTDYPCMYLGSPVRPYYYIMRKVFYPKAEQDNKKGGKVVLTFLVNAEGRMTGYRIKEASTPNFAKAVERVADEIPKDEWPWVPAYVNGKAAAGEYDMTIYFDN